MIAHLTLAVVLSCILVGILDMNPLFASDETPVKRATSPEAAFQLLLDAAKRDNVKDFLSHIGGYGSTFYDVLRAEDELQAAIRKRFGKGSSKLGGVSTFQMDLKQFRTEKFEIRKKILAGAKRAQLIVWRITERAGGARSIHEETWVALKEGEVWKLLLPEKGKFEKATRNAPGGESVTVRVLKYRPLSDADVADTHRVFSAMKQTLQQLAKEVNSGKYVGFKEFSDAFEKAERAALEPAHQVR